MKDPRTPHRMQKAEADSSACESFKTHTPAKLTLRKRTFKNSAAPKKNNTQKKNSTPNKTSKKTGSVVASPGSAQKIDLWQEAKLSAELDAKVYAGRKIHPFFNLWKEENERRRRALSAKKERKGISGSIHVFENVQDDASPIDWSDWTFLDNTTVAYFGRESSNLSFMNGSVESLNLDNIPSALSLSSASMTENVMSCPSQLSIQRDSMLEMSPPNSVVLQKTKCHLKSENVKVDIDLGVNENTFPGYNDIFGKPDTEPQSKFLQASMRSYYHSSEGNSSLWMHKYKPRKASEVCGNEEAINFLRDWLHLWHKRLYQCRKNSSSKGRSKRQDDGGNYASDDIHEGPLQSALLITGPIGSGKSGAVYACAQEQGFHVVEINASTCRNGAAITAIKNKIEEPGAGKITSCFKQVKLLSAGDLSSGIAAKKMDDGTIASSSIDEAYQTLILVEDVDIVFPEDRGFITAIQHFSATAKWPIILTSNRNDGGLPKSFTRLHVSFSSPLTNELLCHMYKVCITEEVNINPLLLKKFIQSCDGDIRKTIMQLQFWFQSKKYSEDRKVPKVYGSLPFDLEACHQIITKILPWNCPSELSQLIEKEVAKSIATMDENSCLQGSVNKEVRINERKEDLHVNCMDNDYSAAKVKRIKRSLTYCNEVQSQHCALSEVSNCSGYPVTSSWQKGQSKFVMMCSGSEKDPNNAHFHVDEEVYKRHPLESNSEHLCKFQMNQTYPSTSFCKPLSSVLEDSEKDRHKYVVSAYDACSKESDCLPGSISVPETAIQNGIKPMSGAVSSCCHAGPLEVSLNNEQTPITFSVCQSFDKLPQNSDPFANTEIPESSSAKAVVLNFKDENTETTNVSNVIDECSHADSISNSKFFDSNPSVPMDMIQKLWRELRIRQKDLGQHANSEQLNVNQVLKLTSGLTNLISEADLLFRNHQQEQCGIMEPPMTLFDEATKSWYDEQMMMSTVAAHGFSFYAKHISDVGSEFGCKNEVDLISEMLASTTNGMALGKLSREDQTKSTGIYSIKLFEMNDPAYETKSTSFSNVIRSIIPARSSLSMKGLALGEYMSSLRQISISEDFRISQGSENMRKRRRVGPHYLSKGRMKLTPEDISALCKGDLYRKISSQYVASTESKSA